MSMIPRCVICDDKIDAHGRGGVRCRACNEAEERKAGLIDPERPPELKPENAGKWL